MARGRRDRRGQHREATRRPRFVRSHSALDVDAETQPLIGMLRTALRAPDPTQFPLQVSALLSALDPRRKGALIPDATPKTTLGELVDSFLGVDIAETTATLHAIAALEPDDLLAARIGRALEARRQPVPVAVRELPRLVPTEAQFMTHILGDGDDVVLRLTWPHGGEATFLVYIDHNLGTVVKDAFVVDTPFDDVVGRLKELSAGHDGTRFEAISLADARAKITAGIAAGLEISPPLESDTWPACRPLLEMLTRRMPEGGTGYEQAAYDEEELERVTEEFLASPEADGLDTAPDSLDADIARLLVDVGAEFLGGDPRRWSPTTVEIALTQWFPLAVAAGPELLHRVPEVMRAVIRHSHRLGGVQADLTNETLAAVDRWLPQYRREIDGPNARAYREALLGLAEIEPGATIGWARRSLVDEVGGEAALATLDAEPLPDEEITWDAIPADVHGRVREVANIVDRFADDQFDVEFRTACRRFLGRAAAKDPAIFRRKGRADTAAAAVAWVIGTANQLVGQYSSGMMSRELHSWFGLSGSSSARARPLLEANGIDPSRLYGRIRLGTPDLLTSAYRARLIERRDRGR